MTAKRKPKVYWTEEESERAIGEAVRISLEDREFIWSFVGKGQKVLPEERRRFITGKAGINAKIVEQFCQTRQEILEEGVPIEVNIEKPPVEILVERPREEILRSVTTEELIALIAKRLAPILEAIPSLFQKGRERPTTSETAFAGGEKRTVQPTRVSAPRRPKVLLYGFLPRQEPVIREGAKSLDFELLFVRKDSLMRGTLPACQWSVMMKKSSHAASDKLKKRFGDRGYIVNGTDAAVEVLFEINSQVGTGVR